MAKITGIEKASYKELVEARDAIEAALAKRKDQERAEELPSCSAAGGVGGRRLPAPSIATRKTPRRHGPAGVANRIGSWRR